MDTCQFLKEFEDVPRVQLYTHKDLEQELNQINNVLLDTNKDWEKRAEAVKRIRSLMVAGALDYDEFYPYLKSLEIPFQLSVKDLRSKVVREACITIAYLSHRIGNKLERFCEGLMPFLFNLIPNSAKIMSTSGIVCIRFIIQYTHGSRLIPAITYNMTSKAKDIRKATCEFLHQLLATWPTRCLEKHVGNLQEAIKKGISDADPEARTFARKAYWAFADHFKVQAECLMRTLDPSKQKLLYGEATGTMSASNSTNSLVSAYLTSNPPTNGSSNHRQQAAPARPPIIPNAMTRSFMSSNSIENLSRPLSSLAGSLRNRSKIPVLSPRNDSISDDENSPSPMRTMSAIDVGAVRRARARAAIAAAMAQPKLKSGYSLPRNGSSRQRLDSFSGVSYSPERVGRSRGRVSQSQPGSRSASPSSARLTYTATAAAERGQWARRKSGIPTTASRETSPTRGNFAAMVRQERLSSGITQIDGSAVASDNRSTPSPPTMSNHSSPLKQPFSPLIVSPLNGSGNGTGDSNSFAAVLTTLRSKYSDPESRKEALKDLTELIREASSTEWSKQFRGVFKLLLEKISEEESGMIRAYALRVMCDLLMKQTKYFHDYIELVILRILEASKDSEKEVHRASEVCAGTCAAVLPSEQCVRVLKSVITTGELPMNQAAIKMLTKLVEQQPKSVVLHLLPEMMPALIQAYDNPESAVRKAAVFAMVAVHNVVGDEMNNYLGALTGSKMKLLKLYIERSRAQTSGSSSPITTANQLSAY